MSLDSLELNFPAIHVVSVMSDWYVPVDTDAAWMILASDSLGICTRFGTYSTDAAINHGLDLEMCVSSNVRLVVKSHSTDKHSYTTFSIAQARADTMARDPDTGLAQL